MTGQSNIMGRRIQGGARGAETRARLIAAALRLFSAHGFDGVTTRRLAEAAHANQAAINYHFGGKDGLYEAVLADIAGGVRLKMGPASDAVRAALVEAKGNRAALAGIIGPFIERLIHAFLDDPDWRPVFGLVMREYSHPSPAFPVLYDGAVGPLHRTMAAIAGAARGESENAPGSILAAHDLIGQCLAFGIARVVLCRRMGWDDYTTGRVSDIAATARRMALGSLGLGEHTGAAEGG